MKKSSSKPQRHHANIYVFELYMQEVTCIQKLKLVKSSNLRNPASFAKSAKIIYGNTIFVVVKSSIKLLQVVRI